MCVCFNALAAALEVEPKYVYQPDEDNVALLRDRIALTIMETGFNLSDPTATDG